MFCLERSVPRDVASVEISPGICGITIGNYFRMCSIFFECCQTTWKGSQCICDTWCPYSLLNANPVGPLDLGLDVLAWVFALRIFHCKIFMNLYESFENSLWRTRWRVFFMWIRQMNFNWCCANLYRLVFHIVKHQSWQLELVAEWRTNSLLLGFLMQP